MKKILLLLLWLPLLLTGCQDKQARLLSKLEKAIQEKFDSVEGEFALAYINTSRPGDQLFMRENDLFHAASTMKTPVMIEVYEQASEGKFSLDDSILVKNEFESIIDSSLFSMELGEDSDEHLYDQIGKQATIRDLVDVMITRSSNLATNILIELVDADRVTFRMRQMGAPNIIVLRGVEDIKAYEAGLSNETSAIDLANIFAALVQHKVVSEEASEEMLDVLKEQEFNDLIPAQLPEDVVVAHKTGWITGVRHDSGAIYLPNGDTYVLTILSRGLTDDEAGKKVIGEVSRLIYDHAVTAF